MLQKMGVDKTDPYLKRWEDRHRKAGVLATAIYIAIPALVGWGVHLATDFGGQVKAGFFVVLAEGLLPVLLVTAVVQWSLFARRQLELDPSELTEKHIDGIAMGFFGLFVVGEGIALYAVAANRSSTFLVVAPLVAGLFLLGDLLLATRRQLAASIDRFLPSKSAAEFAERERKSRISVAEKLERRAKEIREFEK